MAWKIDEIDKKILQILRENADIPNQKLGKKVGLSEPAARRRVSNLVARGIIRRFTIEVDEKDTVNALVFLSTSPHASSEKVAKALEKEEGVMGIWEVSGEMDFAILLSAADMESLNRRVDELRALEEIRKTKTSIIMKKWK
ncbi:MAG: Lrp/AsnC family transcriptional regulator [Candidatus Micrarchaeota archaeon]|nr:Lrp/AsnC family transcriptional regulator [Candidatus Micrarchaeota archaeon]